MQVVTANNFSLCGTSSNQFVFTLKKLINYYAFYCWHELHFLLLYIWTPYIKIQSCTKRYKVLLQDRRLVLPSSAKAHLVALAGTNAHSNTSSALAQSHGTSKCSTRSIQRF